MSEEWLIEPLGEGCWNGCANCAGAPPELPLDAVLYDLGSVDVVSVFNDSGCVWDSSLADDKMSLAEIETHAKCAPNQSWTVVFSTALWGCTYQRQDHGNWRMVEKNRGWA